MIETVSREKNVRPNRSLGDNVRFLLTQLQGEKVRSVRWDEVFEKTSEFSP